MGISQTKSSNWRAQAEALINELSAYARKAARRSSYKWDVQADDVYQQIMLEAWESMDKAMEAEVPIAYLRHHMRFTIGRVVQERYWRKGNGETDQLDDDFDADSGKRDHATLIDAARSIAALPLPQRQAFYHVAIEGKTHAEAAADIGSTARGVQHHMKQAISGLGLGSAALTRKRRDDDVYLFRHVDGEEVRTTRKGLSEQFGISASYVSDMMSGKLKHCKGWSVVR